MQNDSTITVEVTSVPKPGCLYPRTTTAFADTLRYARRGLSSEVSGFTVPEHHKQALVETIAFLIKVKDNCERVQTHHTPDFTGATTPMSNAIRQMFWIHQIRCALNESQTSFNANFFPASLPWMQRKLDALQTPTHENVSQAQDFLKAWRHLVLH